MDHTLTKTSTSNTATPVAIGSFKRGYNCSRPMGVTSATPILIADPDGDFTLAVSFEEIDGNSEYV